MAHPRYLQSRTMKKVRRTAGDLTLNSTAWAAASTTLDIVLNEIQEGDELAYGLSGLLVNQAVLTSFDVATVVGGAPINSFAIRGPVAAPTAGAVSAWTAPEGVYHALSGEAPPYTVAAADIVDGNVTLRLYYATTTATARTLRASAQYPLDVWAWNKGPLQS